METGIANYEDHVAGATIGAREFTITQTVDDVTTPVNLTNVTIEVDFVKCTDRIDLSIGSGITVTDAVNGVFEIDELVFTLVGVWRYDVKLTFPTMPTPTVKYG